MIRRVVVALFLWIFPHLPVEVNPSVPSLANAPFLSRVPDRCAKRWRPRMTLLLTALAIICNSGACFAQSPQTVSLLTDALPVHLVDANTRPTTLGVKFWSLRSGTISAIRFYRGAKSPAGYVARLYSAAGALLGSMTMPAESGSVPGWQQAVFPAPIPIAANTSYIAAYYAPSGQFSESWHGFRNTVSNGPLIAPAASLVGGNGVYSEGNAVPGRDHSDANFFVDVAFVPLGLPYLSIVISPPNLTIVSTTPIGAAVAHVSARWSDGSPFTGTLSLGAPNFSGGGVYALDHDKNLIINPLGPGVSSASDSIGNVTIVATQ